MLREVVCVEKDASQTMIAQINKYAIAMGIAEYRAQSQVSINQQKKDFVFSGSHLF